MKIKTVKLLVVASLTCLALLLAASTYALTPATFQAANLVLGQADFTNGAPGLSDKLMGSPQGVAVDPTTGKVFVADSTNHRVLRFASEAALVSGAPADGVLGQANFTTTIAATGADGMNSPTDVFVDADGELWVADYANHRVLRFDDAATQGPNDLAEVVLGQPSFGTNTPTTSDSGLNGPSAVFVDTDRWLWVADTFNNRVLRFSADFPSEPAQGVLGQSAFDTATAATTQSGMKGPSGLFVDAGRLWVADTSNNRVLRFDNALTKADGDPADGVLGQTSFNSRTAATGDSGMNVPAGVSVDALGRLWVSDHGNNRVLWFDAAAVKADTDGGPADGVLGQPDFTSASANNGGLPSAQSLAGPRGVFYHPAADVLWVADMSNYRVLRYGAPPEMAVLGKNVAIADDDTTPTTDDHTDFGSLPLGQALTRTFTISNSGKTDLILSGAPPVALSSAGDFSVVVQPTTPLLPNTTTPFQVRFVPKVAGLQVVTVTIANNDLDEKSYNFAIQGTGEGTVTSTPAGINCGSVCAVGFVNNQPVTLTAMAAAGSIFIGWEGDCAGIGPCQVTLDGAKTVIAIFATPAGYLPMLFR